MISYRLDEELIPPYYRISDEEQIGTGLTPPKTDVEQIKSQNSYCVYQDGIDKRDKDSDLLKALKAQYKRRDMKESRPIAKIARLYAADLKNHNFNDKKFKSEIKFNKERIGHELKKAEIPGTDWVKKRTAQAIARSLVVPCVIALDANDKVKKAFFNDEFKPPNEITCFALNYRLKKGE